MIRKTVIVVLLLTVLTWVMLLTISRLAGSGVLWGRYYRDHRIHTQLYVDGTGYVGLYPSVA